MGSNEHKYNYVYIYIFFFNCMFYQLLRVPHSSSSTQYGYISGIATVIITTRKQYLYNNEIYLSEYLEN